MNGNAPFAVPRSTEQPSRNTCPYRVRRRVFGHYGIRSDNHIVAKGNRSYQLSACRYITAIADYGDCVMPALPPDRNVLTYDAIFSDYRPFMHYDADSFVAKGASFAYFAFGGDKAIMNEVNPHLIKFRQRL